jgi:uncharacterized membrane protein
MAYDMKALSVIFALWAIVTAIAYPYIYKHLCKRDRMHPVLGLIDRRSDALFTSLMFGGIICVVLSMIYSISK